MCWNVNSGYEADFTALPYNEGHESILFLIISNDKIIGL